MEIWEQKTGYIVGIDEAGRGPLAGPVAVGAVMVRANRMREFTQKFAGIKDSKKLSPQKRAAWAAVLETAKQEGILDWKVSLISAKIIDRKGITHAIKKGIRSTLSRLGSPTERSIVMLDGGLRAPKEYPVQLTIIKGDEKVMVISLASIAAKVMRDHKMEQFARRYPEYHLDEHKGYGTYEHYKCIRKHGPTDIHRKSFLKGVDIHKKTVVV